MMAERGIEVSHTTIMRWVHQYGPELDKKTRKKLKPTGDSWKLDETYIKIKGKWNYLYRAVDKQGNTLDFYLSSHRDQLAAARFLKKLILARHTVVPRVIKTDENAAYGPAIQSAKQTGNLPDKTEHRKVKYLNNRIECDHRRIKRLIKYGLGFHSFKTGCKTIRGYEAMYMIRKGQIRNTKSYLDQVRVIEKLFKLAA
jgi:transposase-like protein